MNRGVLSVKIYPDFMKNNEIDQIAPLWNLYYLHLYLSEKFIGAIFDI